ncbi:MAG: radical SAM protein [Candidatus Njordarchaeales archaeon]
MIENYPRMITKNFKPFDPIWLAKVTEKIVCKRIRGELARKYDDIYVAGVYRGIVTGYAVGCCLRCVFCWSYPSRDFPEKYGKFLTPTEVFDIMKREGIKKGVKKCRLSSCEPTIGREHLISLLEFIEDDPYFKLFILETNGILLGHDKSYVRELTKFSKVYVRVSLKAGTPQDFMWKTGAIPEAFELPFKAIENLIEYEIPFHVAAMSLDPRIMDMEERKRLIIKLLRIDPKLVLTLEEEIIDPYDTTLARLKAAGIKIEWPLKKIYTPAKELLKRFLVRRKRNNFSS